VIVEKRKCDNVNCKQHVDVAYGKVYGGQVVPTEHGMIYLCSACITRMFKSCLGVRRRRRHRF